MVREDTEREVELDGGWGAGAAGSATAVGDGDGVRRLLARVVGARGRLPHALPETLPPLDRLSRFGTGRLQELLGVGPTAAARLVAAFELGRRVELERARPGEALSSPAAVHRLMAPHLRGLDRERFHVLLLDGKHRLQALQRVSEGTLTTSLVHPREVYGPALEGRAAALIVVHNHPSGDPEPSPEDLAVTRRLGEAGRLLGIPLVDHVVVGRGRFVSLRERITW